MMSNAYMSKDRSLMSERDWRIFREDNDIFIKGGTCPWPIRSWKELEGIPEVVRENLSYSGFTNPRPIQM